MFSTVSIIAGIASAGVYLFYVGINFLNKKAYANKGNKVINAANMIDPSWMLGYMLAEIVVGLSVPVSRGVWESMGSFACTFFVLVFIYESLLLLLLPFIRRHFSSLFSYSLWFLPNIVWFEIVAKAENLPQVVLFISENVTKLVVLIWGLGALVIFGWKVISHIFFSQKLLNGAKLVEDEKIMSCWSECKEEFERLPRKLPLYQSEHTSTPLTLGLFRKKVVLPEKEYNKEELKWIFYHEMTHIVRNDIGIKLFIVFFNALCWFIPTMWFLSAKVAEDIELSCDESVLDGEPKENRKLYSNLILQAGGDAKGFSTCLSATGTSMRYRLKQIVHPKKRNAIMETILCTLIVFILVVTFGWVQVSNKKCLAKDLFFNGEISKLEMQELNYEYFLDTDDWSNPYTGSSKKLKKFLENEMLYSVSGRNNSVNFEGEYMADITINGIDYSLDFQDQCMAVSYYDSELESEVYSVYYMPDKNWKKLF